MMDMRIITILPFLDIRFVILVRSLNQNLHNNSFLLISRKFLLYLCFMKIKILLFTITYCFQGLYAQNLGIGMRFFSDFHFAYRAKEHLLINGIFSTGDLGLYFFNYNDFGGIEIGGNFGYKSTKGNFSMPLIMKDLTKDDKQNTALTYIELDIRMGPKLGQVFYPQFGYAAGYRLKMENLVEDNSIPHQLKPFYMNLPVGLSVYLPTQFGNTGFGFFYVIGLTNTLIAEKAYPYKREIGRLHALRFQITVLFGK